MCGIAALVHLKMRENTRILKFKLELNSLYYFVVERRTYAEVMADTRGEPGEIFPT